MKGSVEETGGDLNLRQQEEADNQAKLDVMMEQEKAFIMALNELKVDDATTKEEQLSFAFA